MSKTFNKDEALVLAELAGWAEPPQPRDRKVLDGMPVLVRGESMLWHHSQGVTVADLTGDGHFMSVKYRNHRYYTSLEEAVTKEGEAA